jgi:hypothetical protein
MARWQAARLHHGRAWPPCELPQPRETGFEPAPPDEKSGAVSQRFVCCVRRARLPVPTAGVEPAAFSSSGRRSYRLSYVGPQRPRWESNPRRAILRTAASPLGHRVVSEPAAGLEPTRAALRERCPSGSAGISQGGRWESNPHTRFTAGSRCRFGFGHNIPGRNRTCITSAFAGRHASTTPQG